MTTETEDRVGALEAEVASLKAEISSLTNSYSSMVSGVRRGVLEGVATAEQAMEGRIIAQSRAVANFEDGLSNEITRLTQETNALRDRIDVIEAR